MSGGGVSLPSPGPPEAFSIPDQWLLLKPEFYSGFCAHVFCVLPDWEPLEGRGRVMGLGLGVPRTGPE